MATITNILSSNGAQVVLQSGSGALNIGTVATATTITLGNVTGATAVNINTGTGGYTTTTTNGVFTVVTGTGAISIGADATNKTINIGSTSSSSALTISTGSGAINIGTSATAKTITIGNATGVSAVQINTGSSGFSVVTGTGAISIGADATSKSIFIGSNASGSGSINLGNVSGTQTINILSNSNSGINITGGSGCSIAISSSNTVNLSSSIGIDLEVSSGGSITIGSTSAVSQSIYIGNSTGSSGINLNAGSGGITIAPFTNYGVVGVTSSGVISDIAAGTSGYVLTSNGTGSLPSWQAAGASFTWNNVTSASQTMVANNGYISNDGATLVTFTLPTTAAIGTIMEIQGAGAGLWTISQNSGQSIKFNSVSSTAGATGSVSSTSQYDSVTLICIVANTTWAVNQATGNFSVV